MAEERIGSETVGSAAKGKMTLFKDDRQEDLGAIAFAALLIAVIIVMTLK